MMPDMDGPTTFQQLQVNPATRHIPVILLTARGRAASRLLTELPVTKPFNPYTLADQVAAALSSSV
ncbi:response regulator [Tolypothrix campylonemoides VB511288]|nr:response regulator [Tolypothrix campylonemoides VB511288]